MGGEHLGPDGEVSEAGAERLVDWFDVQRPSLFVGREDELAQLEAWLSDPAVRIVTVEGAAGVGKTALAMALAQRLRTRGGDFLWLAPERDESNAPGPARASVVVIDGLERFSEPLGVLREVLQSAAASTRLLVCTRDPLPARLLADPAIILATRRLPLGPLDAAAAEQLARALGRRDSAPRELMAQTHGNPLLIILGASEDLGGAIGAEAAVHGMLAKASADEAEALYAFAILRHVTEPLLAAMLSAPRERARQLYQRLCRALPVRVSAAGARLPRALRDALIAALGRGAPERLTRYARRGQDALLERLDEALPEALVAETIRDIGFACRFEPYSDILGLGADLPSEAAEPTADELERFLAAVARLDGPTHAEMARRWLETGRATVVAVRRPLQAARGAALFLELDPARPQPVVDPVVEALVDRVTRDLAPLAPGERLVCARCWLDFEDHQDLGSRYTRDVMRLLRRRLLAARATIFAAAHHPADLWLAQSFRPLPALSVAVVDGRRVAIFGHDTRRAAASQIQGHWVEAARTGHVTDRGDLEDWCPPGAGATDVVAAPRDAESRTETVRAALRAFHREASLGRSPLLRLACVRSRAEATPVQALRELLRELAGGIGEAGHDRVLVDVLQATYFDEPRKGLAVAAHLGMGYSTYRRWLRRALERLVDALSEREDAARERGQTSAV